MALTRVGRTDLDIAPTEPAPDFVGLGALGWASLLGIAIATFLLVTNF
jgi:hypothetical protein